MLKAEKIFVPHAACTVASGECFNEGRCLGSCKKLQKADHEKRIKELERKFLQIQMTLIALERKIANLTK